MKLACIVLAHRLPEQLASLLSVLRHPQVQVYLHIDRRKSLASFTRAFEEAGLRDIVLLPRHSSPWGSAEIVDAELEGLAAAVADGCGYSVLLSGQDFPLRPIGEIVSFFEGAESRSYISYHRVSESSERQLGVWHGRYRTDFYAYNVWGRREVCIPRGEDVSSLSWKGRILNGMLRLRGALKQPRRHPSYLRPFMGTQWWNLSRPAAEYVLRFMNEHPDFRRYHTHTYGPDDMFFQSVLLGTDFASRHEVVNDDLRFLARPGTLHRFTLTADQLPAMLESGKFFARKLDVTVDRTVLARLTERITAPDFTGSSQELVKANVVGDAIS